MINIRTQIANALMHELDEHGYEDDDEKRGQVAHHFTDVLLALPGIAITNQGTPNQNHLTDDDIQCPCGDTVPANIAYRDGPQPFHWNNEGGGHTMNPETWKRWQQQETNNEC